jgi:CheY-like chemotaxis protein
VVAVRDDGTGISKVHLPLVFEMFTQVGEEPGRERSGLGIGLALVKKLVELHHGSIAARSEGPGKGSEFIVRLPRADEDRVDDAGIAGDLVRPAIPRRVLVVDDNPDAAESMGTLLRLLGAEVHVVHSGTAALEAFESYRPSAVLLDIGMPDLDGYAVARHIRAATDTSNVLLIAMTGWGQEEDRRRAAEAGFNHHLVKPADIGVLARLLH